MQGRNIPAAAEGRRLAAQEAYRHLYPLLAQCLNLGLTQWQMAQQLDGLGYRTRQGCSWNQVLVSRVLKYVQRQAEASPCHSKI